MNRPRRFFVPSSRDVRDSLRPFWRWLLNTTTPRPSVHYASRHRRRLRVEPLESRTQLNAAPIAVDDWASTASPNEIPIDLLTNDYATASGATLNAWSVSIMDWPANGSVAVDSTNGMASYMPYPGSSGTDVFTYTVQDSNGTVSNEGTVTINVATASAPVAVNDSASTDSATAVPIPLLDNDSATASGATLQPWTVSIVGWPSNGSVSVDSTNGMASYLPYPGSSGTDVFTYTVQDSNGTVSNEATVTINVAAASAPVAVNDSASTDSATAVPIPLLDNDSATASGASLQAWTVSIMDWPSNGSVSVDSTNGMATYTPYPGSSGMDVFTYTVQDSNATVSNAATVTINVADGGGGANQPPSALLAGPVMIQIGDDLTLDGSASWDPDNALGSGIVDYWWDISSLNAAVVTLDWCDLENQFGTLSVGDTITASVTVTDDEGETDSVSISIMVVGSNYPHPVAIDDTPELTDASIVIDVLANDYDDEGLDPASIVISSFPSFGSVSVNSDGTVVYIPGPLSADSFTYTVNNIDGLTSNEATVWLSFPVNLPPIANDDYTHLDSDGTATVNLAVNDYDADDDGLDLTSIVITSPPQYGSVSITSDGTATYLLDPSKLPTDQPVAEDIYRYTIKDNAGQTSNEGSVFVAFAPKAAGACNSLGMGLIKSGKISDLDAPLNATPHDDGAKSWMQEIGLDADPNDYLGVPRAIGTKKDGTTLTSVTALFYVYGKVKCSDDADLKVEVWESRKVEVYDRETDKWIDAPDAALTGGQPISADDLAKLKAGEQIKIGTGWDDRISDTKPKDASKYNHYVLVTDFPRVVFKYPEALTRMKVKQTVIIKDGDQEVDKFTHTFELGYEITKPSKTRPGAKRFLTFGK